jgi:uncharacterized protein
MTLFIFAGALVIALVAGANWVAARDRPLLTQTFDRFLLLNHLGLLFLGGGLLTLDLLGATAVLLEEGADGGDFAILGWTLAFMGGWGAAVTQAGFRRWLYPLIQVRPDSPVHTVALILAGYLIANNIAVFAQGGLEGMVETAVAVSVADVIANQGLFLLLGLFGVGWLIRRDRAALVERLGLSWPDGRQLLISGGIIALMIALQAAAGAVWLYIEPEQAELFNDMNSVILGDFDALWKWLLLALAAGVGEELLFRGAIQPVFGLGFTSLLFAFAHAQYGLTPIFLLVFILGLFLGVVRQRYGTGAAIFIHTGYNLALGIITMLPV